jgi:hypothetical protein
MGLDWKRSDNIFPTCVLIVLLEANDIYLNNMMMVTHYSDGLLGI